VNEKIPEGAIELTYPEFLAMRATPFDRKHISPELGAMGAAVEDLWIGKNGERVFNKFGNGWGVYYYFKN
jgi:hypothetical protein